jgi:hypothetical protein
LTYGGTSYRPMSWRLSADSVCSWWPALSVSSVVRSVSWLLW